MITIENQEVRFNLKSIIEHAYREITYLKSGSE